MRNKLWAVAALVAVVLVFGLPAGAERPQAEEGADPVSETVVVRGEKGDPGEPGTPGSPGPAGHTPTEAETRAVVNMVLDAFAAEMPLEAYKTDLEEAVSEGLIVGYPDGTFRWRGLARRDEVALIMVRAYRKLGGKIEKQGETIAQLEIDLRNFEARVAALEATDQRHDRQLGGLFRETGELRQADTKIRDDLGWSILGFVILLALAIAAMRQD